MSSELLAAHGLFDAEEHRSAARRQLREVYLQAKLDYLRMQTGYQSKDDHLTMKLSHVVSELHDLYSQAPSMRLRHRERVEKREVNYMGGRIPVSDRSIPSYSAIMDKHCTYVSTKNFHSSPFMRLKKAADHAVRYFGGGGGRAPTTDENMLRSNLAFLSPLAKPNTPPPGLRQQRHGSPHRKNNANLLSNRQLMSEALGQTVTPSAMLLREAVGPRPLNAAEPKRGRKSIGPSPTSRKRNKLDHSANEGLPMSPVTIEMPSGEGNTRPPSEPAPKTPPSTDASRLSGVHAGGSRHNSKSGVLKRHDPGARTSIVARHDSPSSSHSPGTRSRHSRRSHGSSSTGSRHDGGMDMEEIGEGLALLERLRQEVTSIKHELVVRGLISAASEDQSVYERPPTAGDDSWLVRAASREASPPVPFGAPRTFTQCLLLQDRLRVSGYAYATEVSVWLTEVGSLEVRLRNMDRAFDMEPLLVHPIFVNKMLGIMPEELMELDDEPRQAKIQAMLEALRVQDDGKTMALMLDPFIYEGVHPLGHRHFRVRVLRLPAGNGLVIMAESMQPEAVQGRLKLVIYDGELEVLLCHQPGLYRRANTQWSTQQVVAEWLVARLSVFSDDSYEGPDGARVTSSHLLLDRSIHLPADRSWAVGEDGNYYTLAAWQEESAIALECRKAGGEVTATDRVPWVEIQAFIGMTMMTQASVELLRRDEDPLPRTPLEYLLARLTITPRGALVIDRVMYKEVRNVSGCTVLLHGSVLGVDLVYRAQRVRLPGYDGEGGGSQLGGDVFTRAVTEKEAVRLMLKEPVEVRRVLFAYLNRALLCRALTDMLRMVEEHGTLRLETALYVPSDLLKLAVRRFEGEKEEVVILGTVLVHSRTTLAQLRKLMHEKLDPESLPPHFTFETHGAPCSSKQEAEWLARDFLPVLFVIPRHGAALFDEYRAAHAKIVKKVSGPGPSKQRRPKTTGSDFLSEGAGSSNQEDEDGHDDDDGSGDDDKRKKKRGGKKKGGKRGLRKGMTMKRKESLRPVAEGGVGVKGEDDRGGGSGGGAAAAGTGVDKAEEEVEVKAEEDVGDREDDELAGEDERKANNRSRGKSKKKLVSKVAEFVAVPLKSRVAITEGDRLVRCSENLTAFIRPGQLIRLEFPSGPEYKVSAHPDDIYCNEAFTLDKPWVRYVPGLEAAALSDKPPPMPVKSAVELEREKAEAAAKARVAEGNHILADAAVSAPPDPTTRGTRSLESLTKEVEREEDMKQPVLLKLGATPTAAATTELAVGEKEGARVAGQEDAKEEKGAKEAGQGEGEAKATGVDEQKDGGGSGSSVTVAQVSTVADDKAPSATTSPSAKPFSPDSHNKPSGTSRQGNKPSGQPTGQEPVKTSANPPAAQPPAVSTNTPILYQNLRVYRIIPKGEDVRSPWRIEYDDEKVPYTLDHRKSKAVQYVLHVKLRLSHLEQWCKDDFTTYKPLHTQRVTFFEKVALDTLVTELFRKLTSGRLASDGVPVNSWQGFVQELDLLPRSIRFVLSGPKLNELLDPSTAITEERRVTLAKAASAVGSGGPVMRPSTGGSADQTRRFGRESVPLMASMVMVEEPTVLPRWSDFLDTAGKIDYQGFNCLLREVAGLHFPRLRLEPETALRTLLLDKLIFKIPDLHVLVWNEAKRMAMDHEAKRTAVVTRLQAHRRRKVVVRWYRRIIAKAVKIQALWRRAIYHWHYKLRLGYLEEDRCLRIRHVSALWIQTVFRCFSAKKKLRTLLEAKEAAYKEALALRRSRQHERRRSRQMGTLYRATRIFAGICTLIKIFKRDGRKSSKNCDMIVRCYIPVSQDTIDFDLPEAQVRVFIERFVNRLGLSVQELTDPQNVQCLANRLIVKKTGDKYSVVFSRRSASERGVKVQRRAARISGNNMVVTVYRTSDEWAFRTYDLTSCEDLRVTVTNKTLRKWLQDEERKTMFQAIVAKRRRLREAVKLVDLAKECVIIDLTKLGDAEEFIRSVGGIEAYEAELLEEEKMVAHNFDPVLLLPRHQPSLLRWMVERITLYVRKGDRQRILVLSYEIERIQQEHSAAKIQGIYRILQAKKVVRGLLRQRYEKRLDWATKKMMYVNLETESRSRFKPKLLGPEDLDDPLDDFRAMKDSRGKKYYLNPATGQVSRMSPTSAARIMQRAIRRRLDREFGRPALQDVVKAMVMINTAPAKYAEFPDRLTTCINYAMVLHTQTFDWVKARDLYQRALKRGLENPTVMRCYAIFLLGSCEEPREANFKRATDLFKHAEVKDPGQEKFQTAIECFFKWSLVVSPQNPHALLNYALVMQGVVGDHDKAEGYYRRALTLSPYDPKVLRNFEDYLQERLPGGLYGSTGPSQFVVRRSTVAEAKELEWAEWQKLKDTKAVKQEFQLYWFDSLTLKTSWERPNFSDHLKARLKRSDVVRNLGDWKQYKDPHFKRGYLFWCHSLTFQLRLDDPFA